MIKDRRAILKKNTRKILYNDLNYLNIPGVLREPIFLLSIIHKHILLHSPAKPFSLSISIQLLEITKIVTNLCSSVLQNGDVQPCAASFIIAEQCVECAEWGQLYNQRQRARTHPDQTDHVRVVQTDQQVQFLNNKSLRSLQGSPFRGRQQLEVD